MLQMLLLRQSLDNQRTVAANVVAALDGADAAVPQVESSGVDLML